MMSSKGNHNVESLFETNTVVTDDNYNTVCAGDSWMAYVPCRMDKHKYNASMADPYFMKYKGQTWGYYAPTEKIVRAIIAHEGTDSYRFKAWFWTYEQNQAMGLDPFENYKGDGAQEKLDALGTNPGKDFHSGAGAYFSCENAGIWNRKLMIPAEDMVHDSFQRDRANRRYMRYAEVLLLYAEACAQLGETGGEGLDALNQVAARAGAPTYTTLSMADVKQEKWFEMWMEGCRFVDLVRWGDASTELANHWKTVPVFYGYKFENGA